jgi:hypothetical protein
VVDNGKREAISLDGKPAQGDHFLTLSGHPARSLRLPPGQPLDAGVVIDQYHVTTDKRGGVQG